MHLPPGNWSSQRHWHSHEDEFVYVLEGELTLIEDGGETVLRAGDCAAFPKGSGNGHHMINRSGAAAYLEASSTRTAPPIPGNSERQTPPLNSMYPTPLVGGGIGPRRPAYCGGGSSSAWVTVAIPVVAQLPRQASPATGPSRSTNT
jgi:Cupin domain